MTQIIEAKLDALCDSVNCVAARLADKHTTVAAGLHDVAGALRNMSVELSLMRAAMLKDKK